MSKESRENAGADDSDGDFDLSGFKPGSAGASEAKPAKAAKPSAPAHAAPSGPKIRGTFPKGAPRTANTPLDGSAPSARPYEGRPSAGAGPRRSDGPGDRPQGKFGPKAGPRAGGRDFRNPELPPSRGAGVPRGPRRYTPRDVADAFAHALGRPVDVEVIPRHAWEQTYRQLGFSPEAARSYACMTGTVLDEQDGWPDSPVRGPTSLEDFICTSANRKY